MNYVFDPLPPWTSLWSWLATAGPLAIGAVLAAGIVAVTLPILAVRRGVRPSLRGLVRGTAIVLLVLFGGLAVAAWGSSSALSSQLQGGGLALLLVAPLALIGLTVATYVGVPGAGRRRVGLIVALRLAAFALVLLLIVRPSVGFPDPTQLRSLLIVALDSSRSMGIQDELGNRSRWDHLTRQVRDSGPLFDRLRDEQQTDVLFVRFAESVTEVEGDNLGAADGVRTEIGRALRDLFERRQTGRPLRALILASDGADNGTVPSKVEAKRWHALHCPIHTLASGKPTTSDRQSDVAITSITTEPSPVRIKGKLTIKLLLDAPGFENSTVRMRVFLDGKEVLARDEALPLTANNPVQLECIAPETPGELRLKVVAEDPNHPGEPPAGDLLPSNNTIETFITVAKDGISALLIDRRRGFEPQSICDALDRDPRIRASKVWLSGDQPLDANAGDFFQFDRQRYDAILIGDVTAKQVRAVDPDALKKIEKQVAAGAGLVMLGGYSTFDNGDWKGTEIEALLPVKLTGERTGQLEEDVQIEPTDAGLRQFLYLLRLDDGKDPRHAWSKLHKLEGITRLGEPKPIGTLLATAAGSNLPVFVTGTYEKGRTLAFAGDTTHRWVRDPQSRQMHSRFWRQMVVWLAQQEAAEGSVWVRPDTRRLPVRSELGLAVGVRSKGGVDLTDGTYKVEIVSPSGERTPVLTANGPTETRGSFDRTVAPGEYKIEVKGEANDPTTGDVVRGEAGARFLVYDEDVEMLRRAADHEFLRNLAAAGGGDFHRVSELPTLLQQMLNNPLARIKPRLNLVPDWRTRERSPFFIWLLAGFVLILSTEWLLRRRWGLA